MIENYEKLTPLFQQYFGIKKDYPGCIVLMQCGDFYEAYGEDAQIFARDLELVLTAKESSGLKIPMAGVPIHALDVYLRGLVNKGHRVAIASQMEDPALAKGLVKRSVTRVITAGTVMDPQILDEKNHNYLLCLVQEGDSLGIAAADITTGEFKAAELSLNEDISSSTPLERCAEEISRIQPSEILIAGKNNKRDFIRQTVDFVCTTLPDISITESPFILSLEESKELLLSQFSLGSLSGLDCAQRGATVMACAGIIRYLQLNTLSASVNLEKPRLYSTADYLVLDSISRRNLELTETLMGRERRGSLLGTIDKTSTSMGARLLREWMLRPLADITEIIKRQDVTQALVDNYDTACVLRKQLSLVLDIERIATRTSFGTANARDLLGLKQSLEAIPKIVEIVKSINCPQLHGIAENVDLHSELKELLNDSLNPDAPILLRDGGLIKPGYHAKLDELREVRDRSKEWLARLEESERNKTGIRSLKVGYTSVFGYYIEVTKANVNLVPDHYIRKQTLVNNERYIIPELKEFEAKVLGAADSIKKLEYELFSKIRQAAADCCDTLRSLSRTIASLDVFCSFAEIAVSRNWCRSEVTNQPMVDLLDSRHPVVEVFKEGEFVSNDCYLDEAKHLIILTGPNMSGKSTWLRQIALNVILNQMGSFVPARKARLGIVDRVFTRVGANDDLHLGQSTFMVEMSETANIVNNATSRSLVILDEIGRGTSTFDGLALARAVVEHLHDATKSLTVFATHFHELTKLERSLSGCRNFRVSVRDLPDDVVFLHKIVPGGTDKSYGIYVAKLAGMPKCVLLRAEYLLKRLEQQSRRRSQGDNVSLVEQVTMFDSCNEGDQKNSNNDSTDS